MAGKEFARLRIIVATLTLTCAGSAWASLPIFEQPAWRALSEDQREVLHPLRSEWDAMDPFRRKKWLGIAERYRDMSPAEQESIQRNMREWARLAPEERNQVRQKYRKLRQVSPEQRETVKLKWEEYSSLPPVTREHMSDIAPKRTQVKTPSKPVVRAVEPTVISPAATLQRSPLSPIKPPQSTLVPHAARKPTSGSAPQAAVVPQE